jgi:DNA-binding response OmpR family regulator/HPt (histidine-containing phosphotransfer) domain-containing protein
MSQDDDLQNALRAVWARRRPSIFERLAVVENAITDALEGTLDDAGRDEAERAAHQIAGSAGTFGFDRASVHARALEHALRDGPPQIGDLPRLAGLAQDLRAELERDDVQGPPDDEDDGRSGGDVGGDAGPGGAGDPDRGGASGPGSAPDGRGGDATAPSGSVTTATATARPAGAPGPLGGPSAGPAATATGPADVLVVGGDPGRAARLTDALLALGLHADVLPGPAEARDALRRLAPGALLLDASLPGGPAAALALLDELADEVPVLVVDRDELLVRDDVTSRRAHGPLPADADVPATAAALSALRDRLRVSGTPVAVSAPGGAAREAIGAALRRAGLVVEAEDGDVRPLLARARPELLVLAGAADAVLAACRTVRNDPRWSALPVLVVAGEGGPSAEEAFAAGADDHLQTDPAAPAGPAGALVGRVRNRLVRVRTLTRGGSVTGPDGAPGGPAVAADGSHPGEAPGDDGVRPTVDVVLVEDDPSIVALLEHALDGRGLTVRHLGDGLQAATALAGDAPTVVGRVVLLDWDLPGIDGLRVLRAMGRNGALEHSRVIMLTARAGEREVLEALEAGATDHVAKPFSLPVLLQRVRGAMLR